MLHLFVKEHVMHTSTALGWTVIAGALAGTGYLFVPTDQHPTDPIAVAILPTGTVELESYGIAGLTPDEQPELGLLHLRVRLTNDKDARWVFDVRDVRLELGTHRAQPLLANGDAIGLPLMSIARGSERMLDLYFALPDTIRRDEDVARFEITWRVTTSAGPLSGRAIFRGLAAEPAYENTEPTGWGPRWWADPDYPWPRFWESPGPIRHRPPSRIDVTRRPQGEPRPLDDNPCNAW
jgi:hypothetical protein